MTKPLSFALATVAMTLGAPSTAQTSGGSGAFRYAAAPSTAATQRQVKAVVERYQAGLNAADFDAIAREFTPDAVAEWNEKPTVIGVAAMRAPYAALFKKTKFSTDFQYDAVDIEGQTAIVRTHHPVGQVEIDRRTGKTTLDFNREIFVLKRVGDAWKIVLYTFSRQPKQGEQ